MRRMEMIEKDLDLTSYNPARLHVELWHPQDVVREPRLSVDGKRRLLATWASDDRAGRRRVLPGFPLARQPGARSCVSLPITSVPPSGRRPEGFMRRMG